MHNESRFERKPDKIEILDAEPKPKKESFLKRNSHIIFWGAVMAFPVMNMATSYMFMKESENTLEAARINEHVEELKALKELYLQS